MKKTITFLFLFLFAVGTLFAATPGSRLSPGIGDIMGQGDMASNPHRIFRLVRWMPLSAAVVKTNLSNWPPLTADSIVIWDLVSDDGITVTVTTTSYDSAVAGVIPVAILGPLTTDTDIGATLTTDTGKRNWGWLQTYGKTNVTMMAAGSVGTAGYAMATSSEPGRANIFTYTVDSVEINASYQGNAGFFYDTGAAAATVEAFLKLD